MWYVYCNGRWLARRLQFIWKNKQFGKNAWLDGLVVERRTGGQEVAGSTLTHCTDEYGKPLTHTILGQQAVELGSIVEGGDHPKPGR